MVSEWLYLLCHVTKLCYITMMPQWARWRPKSPASPLFTRPFIRAQIKENIKAPRHRPLCGEFTGDRWIPRTNGQQRGKCFHLMTSSWYQRFGPIYFSSDWYGNGQVGVRIIATAPSGWWKTILTHWGPNKMAAILQTIFSSACSWRKIYEFRLKFHWKLFLRFEFTILQHRFR